MNPNPLVALNHFTCAVAARSGASGQSRLRDVRPRSRPLSLSRNRRPLPAAPPIAARRDDAPSRARSNRPPSPSRVRRASVHRRPSSSVRCARPPSRIINVNRAIARVSRRRLARPASSASTTTRIIFIRIVRARRARTFPRWRVAIARDGASARGAIATSGRARPVPRAFRCACRRFLGIRGHKVREFCRIVRWYCVRSVGRSE